MRRFVLLLSLVALLSVTSLAQTTLPLQSIRYQLGMSRPVSHLFEVTVEVDFDNQAIGKYLDFQMPKWSPGRYAVFDFAKNVQEVKARVGCITEWERGKPLPKNCPTTPAPVSRVDDQTWRVDLFGNTRGSVTFN